MGESGFFSPGKDMGIYKIGIHALVFHHDIRKLPTPFKIKGSFMILGLRYRFDVNFNYVLFKLYFKRVSNV